MRPTALGLKALAFYGLLTAAFYVSPYTNLFFLLLSFFAGLLLLGAWWTRMNLRRASGRVPQPRPVAAGVEGGKIDVELRARRPCQSVEVVLSLDGRRRSIRVASVDLADGERTIHVTGSLPALSRGVHRVRATSLRSSAPVGLWSAQVAADGPEEIVVHPAPLDPVLARDTGLDLDLDADGRRLAAQSDAGASGLRAWRPGDAVRHVHWRATARRRAPVVREFDAGSRRGMTVWLDRRCEGEELERALSCLVTLALRAVERDCGLDVRTQGLEATFGPGHEPVDDLLRWTATATRAEPDDLPPKAPPQAVRLPVGSGGGR